MSALLENGYWRLARASWLIKLWKQGKRVVRRQDAESIPGALYAPEEAA
eukprot:gene5019-1332_t